MVEPRTTADKSDEQPVWIYLKGGARVEADSATESAAGVWYRRGSLTIFVDRARIDRIEREDLETVAESDSSSKKERGWTTGQRKNRQFDQTERREVWRGSLPDLLRHGTGVSFQPARAIAKRSARADAVDARHRSQIWS